MVCPPAISEAGARRPNVLQMGCPALGVSVAFLKQPTLPGEAPETKKIQKTF
jgi:hypothetical protein